MNDNINEYDLISSILEVKASGIDISNDLTLEQGKTIAELLDDEKNKPK